jgi:hypothetical protein
MPSLGQLRAAQKGHLDLSPFVQGHPGSEPELGTDQS